MLHYFAYGSNLHPMRLSQRVPAVTLVGVAELENYQLLFHKRSNDGSSKCTLFESDAEYESVHGAIYKMDTEEDKDTLDQIEVNGFGYIDTQIRASFQGQEYLCFTYLAQQSYIVDNLKPYHWYKEMVLLGAKYLGFPLSYVESIELVRSMEDPDERRRHEKEVLLQKIRNFR